MSPHSTIILVLGDYLSHVPYRLAQHGLGVTDGGYASMYESDASEPFESTFGNAVGGEILEMVIASDGVDTLEKRAPQLVVDEAGLGDWMKPISGAPTDEDLQALSQKAADRTLEIVSGVFPSVRSRLLDLRDRVAAFILEYARSEASFAREFDEAHEASPRA